MTVLWNYSNRADELNANTAEPSLSFNIGDTSMCNSGNTERAKPESAEQIEQVMRGLKILELIAKSLKET